MIAFKLIGRRCGILSFNTCLFFVAGAKGKICIGFVGRRVGNLSSRCRWFGTNIYGGWCRFFCRNCSTFYDRYGTSHFINSIGCRNSANSCCTSNRFIFTAEIFIIIGFVTNWAWNLCIFCRWVNTNFHYFCQTLVCRCCRSCWSDFSSRRIYFVGRCSCVYFWSSRYFRFLTIY